eukprot:TRINITY_DN28855_c0_g1_i1.p1 TRINITY_DN28855_c0_g1~~TRINITY_DN28855_c0_g1_i1.p1  ORF type:complete len:784 (-),score=115.09 TRINITY_DN28855_c0_g1_i1:157-2508(-)
MKAAAGGAALPSVLVLVATVFPCIHCGTFLRRSVDDNPLLTRLRDPFPPFDAIDVKHVVPAINTLLQESTRERLTLEESTKQKGYNPNVTSLLRPYRLMGERLNKAWGLVQHLSSVRDSEKLRNAIDEVRPKVIKNSQMVSQSQPLYAAFKALKRNEAAFHSLTAAQQRLVTMTLQGFEHSGIGLEGHARAEFNNLTQRLSVLSNLFSENVLDSTKTWSRFATADELRGLPKGPLQLSAEAAKRKREADRAVASNTGNGSAHASSFRNLSTAAGEADASEYAYLLTLDGPSISPVLTYAQDREIRKNMLLAYIEGASDIRGPDNAPVLREVLQSKQRTAELLGFTNYAELALTNRMATRAEADGLLKDLHKVAHPKAVEDLAELRQFASEETNSSIDLQRWDMSFFENKQAKSKFNIDPEELRPYFPVDRCLAGLFDLTRKMFGVTWTETQAPTWHSDVRVYQAHRLKSANASIVTTSQLRGNESVSNASDAGLLVPVGHVFLDLFARVGEKRAGAWQNSLADFDVERGIKPVSVIVASFRPAAEGQHALLSYGELHTLFHEFGHALQSMLTTQKEPALSGYQGVEWDAVELSSQFMEYFLDESQWLVPSIARHYETGQPLELDKLAMVKKLTKANAGLGMLGQVHLSLVDLDLHTTPLRPGEAPQDRDFEVASERKTKLLPRLAEDRFLNSFSHIFAGGYAAGYYSYLFANVLAADAFARFEEADALRDDAASLQRLRDVGDHFAATVLGEGGGRDAASIFKTFRGRDPSPAALLGYTFGAK